jgi:cyclophilin family peptidyl-prolyl cis-trans isomerase
VAATSHHRPSSNTVEDLESRILCRAPRPAKIATAFLDNRGQAFFTVTVALDTSTLSRKTAALYSAGTDGVFGTADDARLYTKVGYRKGRLSLRSDALGLNDKYRVVLNASVIKDVNGLALDGEFNGMPEISGDGTPGGNYDVVSTTATKTTVRLSTVQGYMDVRLNTKFTRITATNFLHYVNEAAWDGTFFHRSVPGFVIQAGGFFVNGSNQIDQVHSEGPIQNEPGISNTRGTIAMAKLGGDPNSATNQFFFNLADNSANLDAQNGGFTAFGEVLDDGGLQVMDQIAALPIVDASSINGAFNELPVTDAQNVQTRPLNPTTDLILIQRAAMLFDVAATPGVSRSLAAAADVTHAAPAAVPAPSPAVSNAVDASAFSALTIDRKHSVLDDTAE